MIKDFECYSKRQRLANGQTQREKRYDDGTSAWLVIDDRKITRQKVRDAFKEQELEAYLQENSWLGI
ncbi:MAG: hypothetical protein KJN62_03025 [Deltaproteobacteria bacterium]|nr:hypothetical protein [Deltaproteobacteria bacterium]